MNVVRENIDELSALLKVQISKDDYAEKVKKTLNNYRRKAEIKGFRTGMAPMSLIQRMYGQSVVVDEINKLISESLGKYIEDEKLDILGEPIPNEDQQKRIDWDKDNDFEFVYEIGFAPKFDMKIDKTLKVPYYNIKISDEDKKKQVENVQQRYGKLVDATTVSDEDIIKADLSQDCENAIKVEDTYISLRLITDEKQKKVFLKKKVGDTFEINVNEVYPKEENRAAFLKLKKEQLAGINPVFTVNVKEVKTFQKAEVNQELFDTAFGKDNVKNEAEFMTKVEEEIHRAYNEESDYRFATDAREILVEKANISLPDKFLRKWLMLINEGKLTEEQINTDFDSFAKDLKWQIIRDRIAKENDIKVEQAEVHSQALVAARYQLAQYGLNNLPDEQMEDFAKRILDDKKQARGLAENVLEQKVLGFIKGHVKLDEKSVSVDDFGKLFEKK